MLYQMQFCPICLPLSGIAPVGSRQMRVNLCPPPNQPSKVYEFLSKAPYRDVLWCPVENLHHHNSSKPDFLLPVCCWQPLAGDWQQQKCPVLVELFLHPDFRKGLIYLWLASNHVAKDDLDLLILLPLPP